MGRLRFAAAALAAAYVADEYYDGPARRREARRVAAVASAAEKLRCGVEPPRDAVLLRARSPWGTPSPVVHVPAAVLGDADGAALWADVEGWALCERWPPSISFGSGQPLFATARVACTHGPPGKQRPGTHTRVSGLACADAARPRTAFTHEPLAAGAARRAFAAAAAAAAAAGDEAAAAALRHAVVSTEGYTFVRAVGTHAAGDVHIDLPLDSEWFAIFSLGCTAVFRAGGVDVLLRSGDALVLHTGMKHFARHGLLGVVPGSCPPALAPALGRGRVMVLRNLPDRPPVLRGVYLAEDAALQEKHSAEALEALRCC